MTEMDRWLESIGLASYISTFRDANIGIDVLRFLEDHHLEDLGIPLGDRLRLTAAIANLPASSARHAQLTVLICDIVGSTTLTQALPVEDYKKIVKQAIHIFSTTHHTQKPNPTSLPSTTPLPSSVTSTDNSMTSSNS